MTNGQLYQYHFEVQKLQGSIILFLLKSRIDQFYKDYGIRIDTILRRRAELQKEYFVFEENNIKHEGQGKDSKPVMLEGKSFDEYMKAYTSLMSEPVNGTLVSLK